MTRAEPLPALIASLDALLERARPPDEVVVVTSRPAPETRAALAAYARRLALSSAELETPTPERARGLALSRASGDWVLALRAGDVVLPGALEALGRARPSESLQVFGGRAGWRDPRGLPVELPRPDPLLEEFLACSREALATFGDLRALHESLGLLSGPALARAMGARGRWTSREGDWIALGPAEDRFDAAARAAPLELLDQIAAAARLLEGELTREEVRAWRAPLEARAVEAYCAALEAALGELGEGSAPLAEGSLGDRALRGVLAGAARGLGELPARLRRALQARASESLGHP